MSHEPNLPADSHVHSQWSWDAPSGSLHASCERAVSLGLPAIAFTEHVDHTAWRVEMSALEPGDPIPDFVHDGVLHPPPFDAAGYLEAVAECRDRFPDLRILTGLELGEPHRHREQVAAVLAAGEFQRVLGSVHSLADGAGFAEPTGLYPHREPGEVLESYLAEVVRLAGSDLGFEILAHLDYPARSWPAAAAPFSPADHEEAFRGALRAVADSERALELNTRLPLHHLLLRWWREEGGRVISFGSDAHDPDAVARDFGDAVALAEAHGFRPGALPHDLWVRA